MKTTRLRCDAVFEEWASEERDTVSLEPRLAARMLFDITLINEFEHALLRLKADDCVWGPVHTSVGQEAVAAGVIAALRPSDSVVATYRSHHEFLSKALQHVTDPAWNPARDAVPPPADEVVERTLAEIMGLARGYCAGRGGSMHLRYAGAGFLGSNPIVGGGIPLAAGAAFAQKFRSTGDVVVCFFGDGATNIGSFHEACNLAGLWKLPLVCFIENNAYAVATPLRQASAVEDLYVRAAAFGMRGYRVDGNDIVGIHALIGRVAGEIRSGGGPCLIEARCYRRYHHAGDQPGSAFGYRTREEEARSRDREVIATFPRALEKAGVLSHADISAVETRARECVARAVDACTLPGTPRTVRPELWPATAGVEDGLRSGGTEWSGVTFSSRGDFRSLTPLRYSNAIADVTGRWLERDPEVVVLGEDVANFGGGAYGATKGLAAKYPGRVLNTPIAEAGFTGLALGMAMTGMKPVVEIMFPDFALVAADQMFNQIGKARHMYGNTTDLPLVVRTRVAIGCGYGGQHSMDPVGLYSLFPGWRIVAPADSMEYIGLFNAAMRSRDPVLVIEHHTLYGSEFPVPEGDLDYCFPLGRARVVAEGTDVTLLTYGALVGRCDKLLGRFAAEGVSVELIDLRTLDLPGIDYETIRESLRKTGAVVVAEEAAASQSIGAPIAAAIMEKFFEMLDGPVVRVASLDIPLPVSRVLERETMVSDERIVRATLAAARRLSPGPGMHVTH
ncbi:MAG TPA: thiamine pyrophosphate-dependent enzyme [Bacteroidota bacterium]|nr:thiamine pyrophosphate-dependent enzyme [Bacteroidota bacterium]